MLEQKSLMSGIISISLIANAVVFTIYINKQIDKTARGIFIATCIYALVALGVKWIL
jgi:tryptophan-rich sensory protein